ncbi:CHAT domain-containing protein [Gulosibacter sp. 10]|uniref:CHAT domain-containing protein n=1 Tax=Gulosibacter sp. 10 TaxID=1255570 RepID=UPI00097E9D51|nr:CHAT domain-containing protein [Gulosibacter sp. 10]SJM66540.1 hypothetical protein FM112_11855 [Gulosibacter sp. 10]
MPTLIVKYIEAVDGYFSWRWDDRPELVEAGRIGAENLAKIDALLARTLPEPASGAPGGDAEPLDRAIARALSEGALASPEAAAALGGALADALLPAPLVEALASRRTERARLRIQPSPRLARVPWALLRPRPAREALLELATIEIGVPRAALAAEQIGTAPVGAAPMGVEPVGADPTAPDGARVLVVDPRVPGAAADSALGSVLGRPREGDALAGLLRADAPALPPATSVEELLRRSDLDRDWLREACAAAAGLLYVGHVTRADPAADGGETAALHLADRGPDGAHLPLAARDILLGGWRIPPRVGLVACGSGADLRSSEPMGIMSAMLLRGARIAIAAAWALPTDRALARGGDLGGRSPLRELVLAVDAALLDEDPAARLNAWQRERAAAWEHGGALADTPLLWASAFVTESLERRGRAVIPAR